MLSASCHSPIAAAAVAPTEICKPCDRYLINKSSIKVAQGVAGEVIGKGTLERHFNYLIKGVKHGFQNLGCNSINILHRKIDEDGLFIEIRTAPAQHEAGVHHLYSYNE